jgi:pyruvate dehydrogenase (quinone)
MASIRSSTRCANDRIRYVGVRHEEAAAFIASGFAKHTGWLGVCVGTTGPGAVHLLNGVYDAYMGGAPVVAITGMTFHDLIGTRYQQRIDTTKLMQEIALYNVEVTGPEHAILVANRACRAALGDRGVAHLAISKDTQMMKLSADKLSMGNPGARTSTSWTPTAAQPTLDSLRAAAAVLNSGRRVAILVGRCFHSHLHLRGIFAPSPPTQVNRRPSGVVTVTSAPAAKVCAGIIANDASVASEPPCWPGLDSEFERQA